MAFKFRKRIKIAPGVSVNLSKSGVSTTIGGKGASVNIGKKGTYLNTSIPGTGLYNRQKLGQQQKVKNDVQADEIIFNPPPSFQEFGGESWRDLTTTNKFWYVIKLLAWFIASTLKTVIKVTDGLLALIKALFVLGFWALVLYFIFKLFF